MEAKIGGRDVPTGNPAVVDSIAVQPDVPTACGMGPLIDLGLGNPDLAPSGRVMQTLVEGLHRHDAHRYAPTGGLPVLNEAVAKWYKRQYGVHINPETETVPTLGSKEGLFHLALALIDDNDEVWVPDPAYEAHVEGFRIARARIRRVPLTSPASFLARLKQSLAATPRPPKVLVVNFPCNPTTDCVEAPFFQELVDLAHRYGFWLINDLAYGGLVFDGKAPSVLAAAGAHEVAAEFSTLSKTYCMAGWRVGVLAGNAEIVRRLCDIKHKTDHGIFRPIQYAAAAALAEGPQFVESVRDIYRQRRDVLCGHLSRIGWVVPKPQATMFVWTPIPAPFRGVGSEVFSQLLERRARVKVFPGVRFGKGGEGYVRFSLVAPANVLREAVDRMGRVLADAGSDLPCAPGGATGSRRRVAAVG